ncbi:thiamine phosphate synthase [Laribacter hongkongensis]|uniref:Thiamine-phosphate synthase n=1 Tax=Laribacter hongkongensis TaxID=168471 RepID=A0ABD4SRF1_9NEIS|nr:thiamine phosphate synthase [Laribacter hongkongensis]MCG9026188.1 thiamine phosphate synthase [Laribacter hongkongensis]MCG9100694.1 thiamine phosphate synthase [Laribacter hongkongensis]MCG9103226.1 thiamine phosphate synthase [Laribacter hongkongensis]MCG9113923.1 thiamine phosphate synthase [Laribacter hongkongensis]MCG9117538.1 thiamine phosphate synthase [Laribacter hongkongensis]
MKMIDYSVYLVLDPDLCGGLDGMLRVTEAAMAGGAGVVQLRAPQWKKRQWLDAARALQLLCRQGGAVFVVNDQVDVALAVGADGVHVGQQDLPVAVVRELMGPQALIGLSVNHAGQLAAVPPEADYLGLGPVFATSTKKDAAPVLGLAQLAGLAAATSLPTVGIGGIAPANAGSVFAAGVDGVAVVSAICTAADPAAVTRELYALKGHTA